MVRLILVPEPSLSFSFSFRASVARAAVAILGCLCVLHTLAAPALAAPAPGAPAAQVADSARAHHEAGRAHASQARFEAAIAEYRKAYELRGDPSYLLDIAEAYRALGVAERAVFFYRRYLTTHPAPPNRPEVEAQIAALDPEGRFAPAPAASAPVPLPTPAPGPVAVPGLQVAASKTVPENERSLVGRWWFWAAVGALAAAGATMAIVAADRRDEDTPRTALGNVKIF